MGSGLSAIDTASAAPYPTHPVHVIVPVAAGGSTDAAARIVGEQLARSLGQPVVIDNRPGAGGNIGIEAAARSPADGYTVLVTTDRIASAPHVYHLALDPTDALVPVVEISRQPVVLAVHPSLGASTLGELIALAKREPGMDYAVGGGIGVQQHFVAAWFAKIAGIKLEPVPYRGGGEAIHDLLAGHVKIGSFGSSPLIPFYRTGALRLLAQSTAERSAALPDVPTFEQAGIKDLVLQQWIGVFVPRGTPAAIVTRLNAEVNKALADPAVRGKLLQQAQEPVGGTTQQFDRRFRGDSARYAQLAATLNIRVQ